MKAVVTKGKGSVEIADVAQPTIEEPDDVILKVAAAAVCGTDLHFIGTPIMSPTTPLGHEFIGDVVEAGSAVHGVAVGQRVKSRMFVCCGHCVACLTGQQTRCPQYLLFGGRGPGGGELAGGQAEYVRIPHADRTLTPIPEGLSDANALLLTDTLPTAWDAVTQPGPPAGKTFVVVGAGPVGQQVIAVALALGASTVYAVDLDDRRLAKAESLGAKAVSATGPAGEQVWDLAGRGVDVAIDAVGSQAAIDTAMRAVTTSGVVVLVGAFLAGEVAFKVRHLFLKNVRIHPLMGNPYANEHLVTPMLTSGRLTLPGVIDAEVPLTDAPRAYEEFAARKVNKIVLVP